MFSVIVAGGRDFGNYSLLVSKLDVLLANRSDVQIVSGGANGADKLGEKYAKEKGLALKIMPADWNKYGKSAGYKRNEEMAASADALVAFWDGQSRGTGHMIDIAKKCGLTIRVISY